MELFKLLGQAIYWIGDNIIADLILRKMPDGSRQVKPEAVRTISPHLVKDHFDKGKQDEAKFGQLVNQLANADEKVLEEYLLAPPLLGREQRADVILSIAELSVLGDQSAIDFLKRLADAGNTEEMKRMLVGRRFMRANEEDYLIVKIEKVVGRSINSMPDLLAGLKDATRKIVVGDMAKANQTVDEFFNRIQSDINNYINKNQNQGGGN